MTKLTKQLWTAFTLIASCLQSSHAQPPDMNFPCETARLLFNQGKAAPEVFQQLNSELDAKSQALQNIIRINSRGLFRGTNDTEAMGLGILGRLFSFRSEPAKKFFMAQNQALCQSLVENTPAHIAGSLFLLVCRSLGAPTISVRACLPLSCETLNAPNLTLNLLLHQLGTRLPEVIQHFRTVLPNFQICHTLTKTQGDELNLLHREYFFKSLAKLNLAFTTEGLDPLDMAHILAQNTTALQAVHNRPGCRILNIRPKSINGGAHFEQVCSKNAPLGYLLLVGGQLYTEASSSMLPLITAILLALGASTWFFHFKKTSAVLATKPQQQQVWQKSKPTAKKSKISKWTQPFQEKPKKSVHTRFEFTHSQNPILKKLADFYVFAEYIYEQRPNAESSTLLNDFYAALEDLPFCFSLDMSEVHHYAKPLKLIESSPLQQWNLLLATAIIACQTDYPNIANELSKCYFLPSDFPPELYTQLLLLKEKLGENHSLTLQGSALGSYEHSTDLDLLIHWEPVALNPIEFLAKLNDIFSPREIKNYHLAKFNIHAYKITLQNGRQIDLSYGPKNPNPSSALFTSAEGKFVLSRSGGIQYSLAYASFLMSKEIQFSSESAGKQLTASVNILASEADENALERVAYALNHLAKAESRSHTISKEIINIIQGLKNRCAEADNALNDFISRRYNGNSGRVFKFMHDQNILYCTKAAELSR